MIRSLVGIHLTEIRRDCQWRRRRAARWTWLGDLSRAEATRVSSYIQECRQTFAQPFTPGRRNPAAAAAVHVPEAAANIDDLPEAGKHLIGTAGERADVEAIAVA
jgi:hypothetical protein